MPDPLKKLAEETERRICALLLVDLVDDEETSKEIDAILLAAFAEVIRLDANWLEAEGEANERHAIDVEHGRDLYAGGAMKQRAGKLRARADALHVPSPTASPPDSPKEENGGKPRPISMCGNAPCTCGTCP